MEALSFQIRRMQEEDIQRVMEIERASSGLIWPERSYRFELRENNAERAWVAFEPDGLVIGFVMLWLILDELHVPNFAVSPEFRRQRVGLALLVNGLAQGWYEGARCSFLEVRSGNRAAIGLYTKLGFEQVSVRKGYYQDNREDAVLMNLDEKGYQNFMDKWGIQWKTN